MIACYHNNYYLLALAVFVRSPSAYEALKSFSILQLPSRATLQSYTGAFLHEPGASSQSIARQAKVYKSFQAEKVKQGQHEPKADGVLIFDEVKVVSSLLWNSRSQKLVGLAMTSNDQASLHDVLMAVRLLLYSSVLVEGLDILF